MSEVVKVDVPATGVTVQVQLSEGRSLTLQTFLSRDASVKDHHALLDKLGVAADRQQAKYRLEGLRISLELHTKTRDQLTSDYEQIETRAAAKWDTRKHGTFKLSPPESAQKQQAEQNIKRYRVEITKIEADIKACEEIIAKDT